MLHGSQTIGIEPAFEKKNENVFRAPGKIASQTC